MTKFKDFFFIDREGDTYTVRMTPELQDDLGTVGYVDFIDQDQLAEGDSFVNFEAAKTVFEAQTPLAGRVVKRNQAAVETPELLNSADPSENWLIQLEDVDAEAYEQLEDAQ
ncbi:glycine cleavage system protein H [Hutsoniella sourekii]|uniref:glycine cleavage system protein H n=1 Tax=Hutsoniella sourekii TaxID=87650 RepID=UPI00048163A6|nr:glycine cleavage system protein H [Hutsoniella sourekii]